MATINGVRAVAWELASEQPDKRCGTPPRPARNVFGRQRRIPICGVTELQVDAKLIVAPIWALRSVLDRDT
jgi:hypothetical protein